MRLDIFKNEIPLTPSLEKAIQHKVEKIEKRLKRYHPDAAHLEMRLDHNQKLNSYECVLRLKAFKDSMHSRKSAPELRVAVDKSFDAIMKELDQYRLKINKSLQAST
jgi:ribosome-associated translation inhibitor RaiA